MVEERAQPSDGDLPALPLNSLSADDLFVFEGEFLLCGLQREVGLTEHGGRRAHLAQRHLKARRLVPAGQQLFPEALLGPLSGRVEIVQEGMIAVLGVLVGGVEGRRHTEPCLDFTDPFA
jgi:hypothetical protein